jgi:hypothetical protein
MENEVHKYEYTPLDGPNDIRVLELTPDAYDQESMIFNCNLRNINLEDRKHPPYYALSYTWKLPDIEEEQAPFRPSPVHVRCDGRILNIGENLFDCLYQLEHLPDDDNNDEPDVVFVWIDAICINQADLGERNSQVAMMQEIYSKAAGTLIWLGRQDKFSLQAVPLIKQLSEVADLYLPEDEEITYDMMLSTGQLHDEEFFSSAGITPLTPLDWNSISSFFSRSWFHRLWTVQELVMGKNDSKLILCGDTSLSLEDISGFIQLAVVKGWVNALRLLEFSRSQNFNTGASLGIEISLGMGAIYEASRESNMSGMLQHLFSYRDGESFLGAKFAWMLNVCRQKKATDERDRIFASSGMISQYRKPGSWHLLGPDYSKSTEDVFTDASKFILQSLGNLSWLSFVQDRSLRVHENLPSWVPDLAAMGRPNCLAMTGNHNVFRNHGGTNPLLRNNILYNLINRDAIDLVDRQQPLGPLILLHDTSLYVKGCKLDKLADTTYDLTKTFLEHKFSNLIIAAAKFTIYEPGDTWLDALMKTLAVGTALEIDLDSGPTVPSPSRDFSDLLTPFLHFLKLEIVQEMWSWNSSGVKGASNWWEVHADFAHLCDLDNLLPSREELDEFLCTFTALYPSHQDAKVNPFIEDKNYLEILHNPALPYIQRSAMSCTCRAFVQTQHSRMGLAPLSARLEDEIWVIEGAKVPFVLRRRLDDSYEFIGEAYIHGIMQGELFEQGNQLDFHYILLE